MTIFVSYARQDQAKVQHLAGMLRQLGRETWVDEGLKGGQSWWDQILWQIRRCDALLVAVSPVSLQSQACTFERQYAVALGKPLLPVLVEPVPDHMLPPELAVLQTVNYVEPGEVSAFALAGAVMGLSAPGSLPEPLPQPPPIPLSYLTSLSHRVSAPTLTLDEQLDIAGRLEMALRAADPEERDGAHGLLNLLAQRGDLYAETQRRIDRAMSQPVTPTGPLAAPVTAADSRAPAAVANTKTPGCVIALACVGAIVIGLIIIGLLSGGTDPCTYDVYGNLYCP